MRGICSEIGFYSLGEKVKCTLIKFRFSVIYFIDMILTNNDKKYITKTNVGKVELLYRSF